MWELLRQLAENMGMIVTIAFLLTRIKSFHLIFRKGLNRQSKVIILITFAIFGIVSHYIGINIMTDHLALTAWNWGVSNGHSSIANTSPVAMVMGGLLGGPLIGMGIALVIGGYRFLYGGIADWATLGSFLVLGLLAGWAGVYLRKRAKVGPLSALVVAFMLEFVHMAILLFLPQPNVLALQLVSLIAVPMITINSLGVWIFALIIENVLREEAKARAVETHKTLLIADKTLPYFRQGLHSAASGEAASIIHQHSGADAIGITNRLDIIAFAGGTQDDHGACEQLLQPFIRRALDTGDRAVFKEQDQAAEEQDKTPYAMVIILPLVVAGEPVGALLMYYRKSQPISEAEEELAEGLSKLFSTQLELGEVERQKKLLMDAEIKALQAQVNPHFLFNSINTLVAVCRSDPMLARKLLLDLGTYFRSNLQGATQLLIPLHKELEHVHAYLALEQARFPGSYCLNVHVEPGLEETLIPPFTLQPLVENSIRHGFAGRRRGGMVAINIHLDQGNVVVRVSDNGRGIDEDRLRQLGHSVVESQKGTGTALHNIKERLQGLYGSEAPMKIVSQPDAGTQVELRFPRTDGGENGHADGFLGGGRIVC
ncbi:LytS/YhcK type 5TM receptor domain-containing protein [Paenibacillus xerothermodurans]|uniref:histidine kinase n=1 Tax=Paenibacillus xerothermodurans TaxID=1977292 RepID=A0A2W1NUH5_PAEXE|nr:LytS/YhcK type 5TM receptor domain-containing protein [Paenibacillus xerothermodurans]PZE21406.1 sensor histidine kinase [Paenibacillus xerothermodurans]